MLVIPAIDIRGGKCVRLRQGDFAREIVFSEDPVSMARHWVEQGATYLHLVDLDGAREGRPISLDIVQAIVKATGVPCELGGGLREETHLQSAFDIGVERVVIGTQALRAAQWFADMCRKYPKKLVLGLDAKDERVATEGWLNVSSLRAVDLAQCHEDLPLAGLIYTDIGRDGMLKGPNFDSIAEMTRVVRLPVFASGGITTLDDVRKLAELPLAGCVVGRALYEGTLNLQEAIRLTSNS